MPSATPANSKEPAPFAINTRSQIAESVEQATIKWDKWTDRLRNRKKPESLRKLLSGNALFWGLTTQEVIHHTMTARLLQLKKSGKSNDEFDWTEAVNEWHERVATSIAPSLALETLAWAHGSPNLVNRLSQADWQKLVIRLCELASNPESADGTMLTSFLLGSELGLTLAYALPEVDVCSVLRESARARFTTTLDAVLDGEGTPHGRHLHVIQLLLASATRMLSMDPHVAKGRVDKVARLQFDWLSRQTLRWTRPNGTCLLQTADDGPFFDELMKSALKLTGDETDALAFKTLRGKCKLQADDDVPLASEHSEWSELAMLSTGWASTATRLGISFCGRELDFDLGVGKQTVFRGSCQPRVTVDAQELEFSTDWEEVCWQTDDDMDYIELEISSTQGWTIQRQVLLARKDKFLYIADAVLGQETANLKYALPLPFASDVLIEQGEETTEAQILGARRIGNIVPLSFPEWKSELRGQTLRLEPARHEIERRCRALYAPLFFDLDRSRLQKAITWRRLSVGQDLEKVTDETAVAYRLQIGKRQWVFYRSLDKPANRTFIGQNLISEFVAARFQSDGKTERLIDIEG